MVRCWYVVQTPPLDCFALCNVFLCSGRFWPGLWCRSCVVVRLHVAVGFFGPVPRRVGLLRCRLAVVCWRVLRRVLVRCCDWCGVAMRGAVLFELCGCVAPPPPLVVFLGVVRWSVSCFVLPWSVVWCAFSFAWCRVVLCLFPFGRVLSCAPFVALFVLVLSSAASGLLFGAVLCPAALHCVCLCSTRVRVPCCLAGCCAVSCCFDFIVLCCAALFCAELFSSAL